MSEYGHNSLGFKVFSYILFVCGRLYFPKIVTTIFPVSFVLLQYDFAIPIKRQSLIPLSLNLGDL